jgi:2-methylcitrate dehydratase PrpD
VTNLPAALAVAERRGGVSGKEFLLALNLGIDLTCRLGLAIGGASGFETRPVNFIRSAVCGCFGACLVAGKLLGFSKDQMVNALGIALSQVGGTRQVVVDSAMTKRYQPAFAAQAGILSVLLGEKGVTGCRNVFEGPYGFFNSYWGGHYVRQELIDDLGRRFEAANISIKPYPCCRYNHGAIDAALQSRTEFGLSADDVTSVSIRLPEQSFYDVVSRPFAVGGNPIINGQFSMTYTVASALIDGYVFLDTFEPTTVRQERRKALADKVRVKRDLPVKDKKSLGPVVYKITPSEGTTCTVTVEHFKGSPQNPMSRQDCVEKFKRCLNHVDASFSEAQITGLTERIFALETLEDVTSIIHPS